MMNRYLITTLSTFENINIVYANSAEEALKVLETEGAEFYQKHLGEEIKEVVEQDSKVDYHKLLTNAGYM